MEKLFVPYELAIQLKENGFNEPCLGFYTTKYNYSDKSFEPKLFISENEKETLMIRRVVKDCSAPLYDQVIDWFENKGIEIKIHRKFPSPYTYGFNINNFQFCGVRNKFEFKNEARDKAIKDALSML